MSGENEYRILSRQDARPTGAATVYPILGKSHGNPPFGVGVSEHVAGTLEAFLNYDEAIFLLEGDLTMVKGDERFSPEPGQVLWMPRGSQVSYVSDGGCKYIYLTSAATPNS